LKLDVFAGTTHPAASPRSTAEGKKKKGIKKITCLSVFVRMGSAIGLARKLSSTLGEKEEREGASRGKLNFLPARK